jgi:hypothetical protein|tara:strand:+ start:2602 stop:4032 length:1431 start_codon:yes stop_codon:yes gene_type:complete
MALTKATNRMTSGAVVNVFDFMTSAEIVNVKNLVDGGDLQPAIQAAFDYVTLSGSGGKGMSVFFPSGRYYMSSTVSIPNGTVMFGEGRNQTAFRARPGFTGVMFTDKGNASKVVLRDFRIDGMGEAGITDLIKMGYGAEPLGGGEWNNLFLYSGQVGSPASHIKAINAVTNVFSFTEIEAGFSGTDFYLGPNSGVTFFTRCLSISSVDYGFYGNGSLSINNCEIEAPTASCIGVYASRETVIQDLTYAQAPSVTNPFAIEIDASCSMFTLSGFINTQAAGSVLTSLLKDNRSAYPTSWGNRSTTLKNMPLLADDLSLANGAIWIQNQKRQSFRFRLRNNAGTFEHQIGTVLDLTIDPVLADKITGATATVTSTPTGTDASTAFAAGAKISSANTSIVIFNTESQINSYWAGRATININSTGTALTVYLVSNSFNVNGVTRNYLIMQFLDASSGANFDLLSIASTAFIDLTVETYLA